MAPGLYGLVRDVSLIKQPRKAFKTTGKSHTRDNEAPGNTWGVAGRPGGWGGRGREALVGSAASGPGGEAWGVLGPGVLRGLETCLGAGGRKWGVRCKRFAGWTEDSVLPGGHATLASGSEGLTLQAAWQTWVIRQRRASHSSPTSATRPAGSWTWRRRRRLTGANRDQPQRPCSSGQAGPQWGGQEAGHEGCSPPQKPFSS